MKPNVARQETVMRLEIKTDGTLFRVASAVKPRMDYKDKDRQAKDRDGRPIWTVSLDAIDAERKTKETIWVEVAGDEPKLTFDGYAVVRRLVFAPWVGRDGKIKRAFRAALVGRRSGRPPRGRQVSRKERACTPSVTTSPR